jgi:hypothetical protein
MRAHFDPNCDTMSILVDTKAGEILASGGTPIVAANVLLDSGTVSREAVPSGASLIWPADANLGVRGRHDFSAISA